MTPPLLTDFDPRTGIARLTFNRPGVLNAIDVPLARALLDASRELAACGAQVRCVVLIGNGRAFMAGGDIDGFRDGRAAWSVNALLDALHPAILTLRALDAPIVAAVRGAAAGAGLSLALLADLVLAEDTARFILAYDRLGTVPDCGGSWCLPRKVGSGRASELMLLGRTLSAAEAHAWGIVTSIAPAAEFDTALETMAAQLAAGPTRAFGAFRRLLDHSAGQPLSAHLEAERDAFLALLETEDFNEGVAAFSEKRLPHFQGR